MKLTEAVKVPEGYKPYLAKEFKDAGYEVYYKNREDGSKHFIAYRSGRANAQLAKQFIVKPGDSIQKKGIASFKADAVRDVSYNGTVADKKAAKADHGVEPGQIYVTSWGYSMTLVDFYRVKEVKGQSATLEELGQFKTGGGYTGETTPDTTKVLGSLKVRITGKQQMKVGRQYVRLWGGKPMYYNTMD